MSYICDNCEETKKLIPTKKRKYLCQNCYKEEKNNIENTEIITF